MAPASSFEFFYFELHGLGLPSRIILSLSGFNWSNKYPKNWSEEKPTTPFGKLPVLTEHRADGSKFVLAESSAINRYLARKANLHGDNEEEAAVIDQFASNWIDLLFKGRPARNLKDSNPEQYNVEYPKYLDTELKPALNKHEEYLTNSASGYYVGDKLSLADIIALVAVTHINDHNVEITEESYPHIYKLYQKVSALEAVEAELTRFSQKK